MSANTIQLDDATFDDTIKGETPVLVDFWAEWCGPCKALAPTIDKIADEFEGRVHVAKVDIEASPSIASRFGIMSIPTVILFRNGEATEVWTGAKPEEFYREELEKALDS